MLVGAPTLVVVILNFADVAPAGTITLAGTVADESELLKLTITPLEGANPFRYTVPVAGIPPITAAEDSARDVNPNGLTVKTAGFVRPAYAAEIVTLVWAATLVVAISNFAEVAPAGTVTLFGTVADELELLKLTTTPLDGAGPFRYTLPVDGIPPTKAKEDSPMDNKDGGFTVKTADFVIPAYTLEMVTLVGAATFVVVMVNFAEVAPSGTVTLAGTVTQAFELCN